MYVRYEYDTTSDVVWSNVWPKDLVGIQKKKGGGGRIAYEYSVGLTSSQPIKHRSLLSPPTACFLWIVPDCHPTSTLRTSIRRRSTPQSPSHAKKKRVAAIYARRSVGCIRLWLCSLKPTREALSFAREQDTSTRKKSLPCSRRHVPIALTGHGRPGGASANLLHLAVMPTVVSRTFCVQLPLYEEEKKEKKKKKLPLYHRNARRSSGVTLDHKRLSGLTPPP